jgi:hypothetical protein
MQGPESYIAITHENEDIFVVPSWGVKKALEEF